MIESEQFNSITDKIVKKNMVGHAYLLQVGSNYITENVIVFIKKIISSYNISDENIQNIFNQIDAGTFSDIYKITPDGQWIKKEQILNLQDEFKTKSIYSEKRFYIIEYAENMNKSAYNTLLKFLEEPDNDVVALLVTKNINLVPETITSRCLKLNLIKETTKLEIFDDSKIEEALNYLDILLEYKKKSVPHLANLYKSKTDEFIEILQIWITTLYEIINKNTLYFEKNTKFYDKITNKYDIKELINYSCIMDGIINMFGKNFNNKLLLDKLIIDMFGVE